jgi:hypothetical protein
LWIQGTDLFIPKNNSFASFETAMGEIQRLNCIPTFRDATGLSRAQHTSVFSCMIVSTDLRDPAHPQRQQGCVIHTHASYTHTRRPFSLSPLFDSGCCGAWRARACAPTAPSCLPLSRIRGCVPLPARSPLAVCTPTPLFACHSHVSFAMSHSLRGPLMGQAAASIHAQVRCLATGSGAAPPDHEAAALLRIGPRPLLLSPHTHTHTSVVRIRSWRRARVGWVALGGWL